jgi:hypothetical protein
MYYTLKKRGKYEVATHYKHFWGESTKPEKETN